MKEILQHYINPIYLDERYIRVLKETVKAQPVSKYLVLDNFFREDILDEIIEEHKQLRFNEAADRLGTDGAWLPYDSALAGCKMESKLGNLLYSEEWMQFTTDLVGLPQQARKTEIKLRYHSPEADGFWIHTDQSGSVNGARDLVVIGYYNKDWTYDDGGLLQLWRLDETTLPDTPLYTFEDALAGPMNFLNQSRIKALPAGANNSITKPQDFLLMDQIIPAYNRVFICNFKEEPAYHSITPSKGKVRQGFVQWFLGT